MSQGGAMAPVPPPPAAASAGVGPSGTFCLERELEDFLLGTGVGVGSGIFFRSRWRQKKSGSVSLFLGHGGSILKMHSYMKWPYYYYMSFANNYCWFLIPLVFFYKDTFLGGVFLLAVQERLNLIQSPAATGKAPSPPLDGRLLWLIFNRKQQC